jgi:hypothetical protein
MEINNLDFEKYIKNLSSRHHYIPQFLLNGFVNSDKQLYIYDKQKDEILKKPRPPKAVFFENDRNTIELDNSTKTSIIEDLIYKQIDNKTSEIVKEYQTTELSKIDFKTEDTAIFIFFLITLFWRIPKTDYAASKIMDRSKISASGIDTEVLRNDLAYRKLNRTGLFKHHIDELKNFGKKGKKWVNLHQNQNDIYVIGDYPILFRNPANKFREFNDSDILIAVSSKRIYSSTNTPLTNFSVKNSLKYNACIVNQSTRYIASGNLNLLEQSVLFYKKLKEMGIMYSVDEEVFKTE